MRKIILSCCLLLVLYSCNEEKNTIFERTTSADSGIKFSNNLTENDSLNYLSYAYMYMGGGVSVGDINNDGLKDLFFTGNMVPNRLYLNKGDLKFEDISKSAKVLGDSRWFTGVTMADVNGDGFLDIYCSVGGKFGPKENLLYINNGDATFNESAKEFGLADVGNSVQATFFDYDLDGDLDVYITNYPPTRFNAPNSHYRFKMNSPKDVETDKLFRNDGSTFVDVTEEAGLKTFGLSLSTTVGDLNNDGWPDLYVSNDFSSPDFMFFNNQDGTFTEQVKKTTKHTAFYGMGVDIADYNNDQLLDIIQVDMMSKNNRRQKANMASMNPKLFWSTVNSGFHYQYMQNNLQLNNGLMNENNLPDFSDVSRLAGLSSTDWSWGPLFADLDNDGLKDIFISNGTRREINNRDYFNEIKKLKLSKEDLLQKSLEIPSEKIDNFVFRNSGNLEFEQVNEEWGIEYKGFSNGVVYADLDNDGDLEIVLNNIDDEAIIFENKSSENHNYIGIQFEGNGGNKFGLGNRVYLTIGDQTQMQELTLTRGFQSSVAPEMLFGAKNNETIDQIKVVWTDGKTQVLTGVSVNQKITLKHSEAKEVIVDVKQKEQLFTAATGDVFPEHKHIENQYDDFYDQVLLPHKMSQFGPALAVGDLDNDGMDDYFIGGSSNYQGTIYLQKEDGFVKLETDVFMPTQMSEDVGAHIFDADQDGDNDLYVVSGGYEFNPNSKWLQDRLYINKGNGNFELAEPGVLPEMFTSGSKVYSDDLNKDGKLDLIILGRQVPKNYPATPKSYVLYNVSENNKVQFEDVTHKVAPEFSNLGMATSAVVTDFNNDSWSDIIVVGEWMPIRVFRNSKNGFNEVSESMGLNLDTTGWWWSISEGDFDNDGDMDYIVGNNGLNYKYKATEEETFDIFINDFDKDEKADIVLSYYNEGEQYPVRGRECSSQQIPAIKTKYKNYESFSEATLVDIYTENDLEKSVHYQVKSFASIYLENVGDKFLIRELPNEAQISSINQTLVNDYNEDGNLDILIAGNLHVSEIETTRNDAGYGRLLLGDGHGSFDAISAGKSGFFTPGDVKDMATIRFKDDAYIISVKNDDYIQLMKIVD